MTSVIVLYLFIAVVQNIETIHGSVGDHRNSQFYMTLSDKVNQRINQLMDGKMGDLKEKVQTKVKELARTSDYLFDQAFNLIRIEKVKRTGQLESLKRKRMEAIKGKAMAIVNRTEHIIIGGMSSMRSFILATRKEIQDKMEEDFKQLGEDVQNETILGRTYINEQTSDFLKSISFKQQETIYFAAILSDNVDPTADYVKFDSVLTNNGAGYDGQTGIFTVPRSGCYVFTCTFLVGSGYVNVQMTKNGKEIAKGYAAEHIEEQSSVLSENLELVMGDKIGVRLIPNRSTGVIRGNFYSSFSGFIAE